MNELLDNLHDKGFDFIKIEPGCFTMGHIADDVFAKDNETPHSVLLSKPYYMLKTPVSVKQYREYVSANCLDTSYLIEKWDGNDWVTGPYFDEINSDDNYPVVGVSYYDAIGYIEWISQKFNATFRLPTEAEFEFAARGGCNCIGSCKYAQIARINSLDRKEEEMPRRKSFPIDKMIMNDYGLLGMHCSIWQWCNDWFFYYSGDSLDPTGPIRQPDYAPWKGERWKPGKVIRGGSFSYPFYHSRCSDRHYSLVGDRNYNLGFRIVLDIEV